MLWLSCLQNTVMRVIAMHNAVHANIIVIDSITTSLSVVDPLGQYVPPGHYDIE